MKLILDGQRRHRGKGGYLILLEGKDYTDDYHMTYSELVILVKLATAKMTGNEWVHNKDINDTYTSRYIHRIHKKLGRRITEPDYSCHVRIKTKDIEIRPNMYNISSEITSYLECIG